MADENGFRLPGRDEVTAYITDGGLIALKQHNPLDDSDSSIVLLLPADVPTVVTWLHQLAERIASES
jgi:hypothetical protein